MEIEVRRAEARDWDTVRELLREYGAHLAGRAEARICIAGYEEELSGLPGAYAEPEGVVLLAVADGRAAGCVAFRPMRGDGDERACEMKRLWVGGGYRGLGVGRRLAEAGIVWARERGFGAMFLDTVPGAMVEANALYRGLGFETVGRYNDNPVADVVFLRLGL